jgi:23S rRNA (cytosine1962-C5)-methyltransferase
MHTVILKEGREKSVLRRHPWIFSGAIREVAGNPGPGETVIVRSARGEFLAHGAYAAESHIPVKLWNFMETEAVDEAFFRKRLASAFELRKTVFRGGLPDAYRLVCAESDGLPGLVADVYGEYAVCQITGAGMERHRELIGGLLLDYARGVYERSDVDSRAKDGLPFRTGHLAGEPLPDVLEFTENGVLYRVDCLTGHKTGFYLDQRENRRLVTECAAGAESVLNCFSYTGGFGLSALKGGAKHVLNVDSSAPALECARELAELNGFSPDAFETKEADVFQFLRSCRDARKSFDLIVLDPPKFAETVSQRERAARAYKDINLLAVKLLNPGGQLFTFSCSGAIDDGLFAKIVDSAASDAHRPLRTVRWLSQGPDHPVLTSFPEGRYLKGLQLAASV